MEDCILEGCLVTKVFFKLWGQAKWRVLKFTSRQTFYWWLSNIGSMEPTAIIILSHLRHDPDRDLAGTQTAQRTPERTAAKGADG